ncbi:MAG TPA: hypothetical protein ENI23_13315 [bacterium]|nr:hypothetical protein [bacterium]
MESEGHRLLTKQYNNAHQKLDYICPQGHKHSIKWNHWKSGHRCPHCDGQTKPLFDSVKTSFEKEGYLLVSSSYVNSKHKLEYICPLGHKHEISWSHWNLRKQRCPTCRNIEMSGKGHWNWNGGKTPKDVKIRFSVRYIKWRSSIFNRDKYTCQMCGKIGRKLQAHHIFRFGLYKLRRFKPWNDITLCKKCHMKIKGDENSLIPKFLYSNLRKYGKKLYLKQICKEC